MLYNSAFVAASATELSVDLRSNPQLIKSTCTGSRPSQLNISESLNCLHDYSMAQPALFNLRVCLSVSNKSYPLERTKTDPEEHRKYQTDSAGCNDDSKNVIDGRDDDTDHSGLVRSAQ